MATELEMTNRGTNNPGTSGGNSASHIAARNGDLGTLKELMSEGYVEDKINDDGWTTFHMACRYGWLQVVRYLATMFGKEKAIEIAKMMDNNNRTALHLAAIGGHLNVTAELLIKLELNINECKKDGLTPLQSAATAGQADMMEFLLDTKDCERPDTLLHLACQYGHAECVTRLITRKADLSLVCTFDGKERVSCIDLAIDNGHRSVVEVLISEKDQFMSVMQHPYINEEGSIMTPFRRLIQDMPDMAKKALDMCMKQDTEVQWDLLEDTDMIHKCMDDGVLSSDETRVAEYLDNKTEVKNNHPLLMMINDEEQQPLFHPLVNGLLQYKWRTVGRNVYIASVFLHLILISFITTFALIVPSPKSIYSDGGSQQVEQPGPNGTTYQNVSLNSCQMRKNLDNSKSSNTPRNQPAAIVCTVFILVIVTIRGLLELCQVCQTPFKYFRKDKLVKLTLYITAIAFVVPTPCPYYRQPWQWELGTVAVVMVWIELTLQIRWCKLVRGIYVIMFLHIIDTFLQVVLLAIPSIIGFAIGFYMLFYNQSEFNSVGDLIVKTIVMITGEFGVATIFHSSEHPIIYPPASYILFVLFLAIMAILFINLLVALAIYDVEEIQKRAKLTKRVMEVNLALDVEYLLPNWCRKCLERISCSCCRYSEKAVIEDDSSIKPDTKMLLKEQDIIKSELKKLMAMPDTKMLLSEQDMIKSELKKLMAMPDTKMLLNEQDIIKSELKKLMAMPDTKMLLNEQDIIKSELKKLMAMSDTERLLEEQDIIKSELKELKTMIQELKKD